MNRFLSLKKITHFVQPGQVINIRRFDHGHIKKYQWHQHKIVEDCLAKEIAKRKHEIEHHNFQKLLTSYNGNKSKSDCNFVDTSDELSQIRRQLLSLHQNDTLFTKKIGTIENKLNRVLEILNKMK